MKYHSPLILFTFLIYFTNNVHSFHQSLNITRSICWDVPDPLNSWYRIQTSCPTIKSSGSKKRAPINNSEMFITSFQCKVDDSALCKKVKKAFDTAGQIITSTIKLNTPLLVNATLLDFCKTLNQCPDNLGHVTLGGAGPARFIPLEGPDGVQRVYPQALLKQLVQGIDIGFYQYDINAYFNSQMDYWFEGDGSIEPGQSDFLFVILHELIHGLGFASGWDLYGEILGVPDIITPSPFIFQENDGKFIFGGFQEFILDEFMVLLPEGNRASEITVELNKFSGIGIKYDSLGDFLNSFATSFSSSPQYKIAQQMMARSTTPKTLGILPLNKNDVKDAFILETSISPYRPKSSISHCDYATYTNTSDFLMRYLQDPGVSLKESIRLGKNYAGGPIGPKLTETLTLLG
ncbi:1623_t:CDS:1 [Funneliformis geosporum]|nr:1623_t:CDS:1 [Funneliformis geosporum]